MALNLQLLGLQLESPLAIPGVKNFRPPSWPPPPDWAPVVDAKGDPQCRYADSIWPLDVWAGSPLKINFGDGKTRGDRVDPVNAELLRQCAVWFLWGPRGCRTAVSFAEKFRKIKPIFVTCSQQGIAASDLMKFEAVIDQVAVSLAKSRFAATLMVLHELVDAKEQLGFCILDRIGLARLLRLMPNHDLRQTPYIPPRIWSYQLSRMRECLEDYTAHQAQIEGCFRLCLDAYAWKHGSLKLAVSAKHRSESASPFVKRTSDQFDGLSSFKQAADRFGLVELIEKWVGPFKRGKGEKGLSKFSQYLDIVSIAGLGYLMNLSLMRIEEAWNLRSDCLLVERDDSFGEIHILCGETTKTDPDANARWPASKSVELAVDAMKQIAALRMICACERDDFELKPGDVCNPHLITYQYEPWSLGRHKAIQIRPKIRTYQQLLSIYPQLLDLSQITTTEEDLRIARLLTPSLDESVYQVGTPWRLNWHQFRRTGAVNMLSSDMVDESSLQLLLKHQSRVMTLYYARNHSRLALSEETRTLFLKTMYQEIGRDLLKLQSPQFVSPLGTERKESIVAIIRNSDASALEKAARQGKIGARRIRAGFCVNHRPCPYGGVEAISHCLGSGSSRGCPDLMLDIGRESNIENYEKAIDVQLKAVHPDSPRYRSLLAEKSAIGKFYDIVQSKIR